MYCAAQAAQPDPAAPQPDVHSATVDDPQDEVDVEAAASKAQRVCCRSPILMHFYVASSDPSRNGGVHAAANSCMSPSASECLRGCDRFAVLCVDSHRAAECTLLSVLSAF